MKKSILLLFILLLVGIIDSLYAKDIYLSATGNDENSGLSPDKAVKSLLRVNELISAGDIIHISGIIKITEEPDFATKTYQKDWNDNLNTGAGIQLCHRGYLFRASSDNWASVTIRGSDSKEDGFSGEKRSPLFAFETFDDEITFKNLCFINAVSRRLEGTMSSEASTIWCRAVSEGITFENCIFENNNKEGLTPGNEQDDGVRGTILVDGGKATFVECQFIANQAQRGGGLFFTGGSLSIDNCYFAENQGDDVGGAIYIWPQGGGAAGDYLNVNITGTIFKDNIARKGAGVAVMYVDHDSREKQISTTLTIDRCALIGNRTLDWEGGAFLYDYENPGGMTGGRPASIAITNSLFYGNESSDGAGIALWSAQPDSEFIMVNSTISGNISRGGNAGHGPGIVISAEKSSHQNIDKKIYNCIFEDNLHSGGSQSGGDFIFRVDPVVGDKVDIQNCYMASTNADGKPGVADNNKWFYNEDEAVGFFPDREECITLYNALPLTADALGRTFGNAEYLAIYNIGRDLSGLERISIDGKCAIGACEVLLEDLSEGFDLDLYKPRHFYTDGGWETICIPYDVNEIVDVDGNPVNGYSLKEFKDVTITETTETLNFVNAPSIKAGVPYIISMPVVDGSTTSRYYMAVERSTEKTVPEAVENNGYSFCGTFNEITTGAVGKYVLNGVGDTFVKGIDESILGNNKAYFTIFDDNPNQSRKLLINLDGNNPTTIYSSDADCLRIYSMGNGKLEITTDTPQQINLISMDGCSIRTIRLNAGVNYIDNLLKGIYLINNHKVVVK